MHPAWTPVGQTGPTDPAQNATHLPRQSAFPNHHRVFTYVNKRVGVASIEQVGIEHPDIILLRVSLQRSGPITAFYLANIYNPPKTANTAAILHFAIDELPHLPNLVVGDFNAHHPLWESRCTTVSREAETWVTCLGELGLEVLTPRDLETYTSERGRPSTIDLAAGSDEIARRVVSVELIAGAHGSDHSGVNVEIDLAMPEPPAPSRRDVKKVEPEALAREAARRWQDERPESPPETKQELDIFAMQLEACIDGAISATAPVTRPCPRSKPWYGPELKRMQKECQRARRLWQAARAADVPTQEIEHDTYKASRNAYIDAIRNAKRAHGRAMFESLPGGRDLWKVAKRGKPQSSSIVEAITRPDGTVADTLAAKAEALSHKFFGTGQGDQDEETDDEDLHGTVPATWPHFAWRPFTREEVGDRVRRASPDTAPGPDGISWRVLQALAFSSAWTDFLEILADFFTRCIALQHHPEAYKTAEVVVIRKHGKASYKQAGSYRPISLINTTGKLLEALVAARILHAAEADNAVLGKEHFGGRPNRSTSDALTSLQHFIRDANRNDRAVAVVALDAEGAYNAVRAPIMLKDLIASRVPPDVAHWMVSFCTGRKACLRISGQRCPAIEINIGLPQGSPLSQVAWLIYSKGMLATTGGAVYTRSIGWVDDKTLAVSAHPAELQAATNAALAPAAEWARSHRVTFDPAKATLVSFNGRRARVELPEVVVGDLGIPQSDCTKILGVTLHESGSWAPHLSKVVAKATKATLALMSWGNRAWGFNWSHARTLYIAGVLPIVTHGCLAWYNPLRPSPPMAAALTRLQRTAALLITGGFRSTPTIALDFEADLLPIDLHIRQVAAREFLRLCAAPVNHPLTDLVRRATSRQPDTHRGPLHHSAVAYPRILAESVGHRASRRDPSEDTPSTVVPETKELGLAWHLATRAAQRDDTANIYTDGSKHSNNVGFGVFIEGPTGQQEHMGFLGPDATVFRAEVLAIREATRHLPACKTYLWCDNRAAVLAIGSRSTEDADVREIQQALRGKNIVISWLPGHKDVAGNERADQLAKRAVDEGMAGTLGLTETPFDRAVVWHGVKTMIKAAWQRRWTQSTKGKQLRKVNRLKVGKVHAIYRGLTRKIASLLCQLRTGHCALNSYLAWRRVPDAVPICRTCGQVESAVHLIVCRRWEELHRERRRALRSDLRSRSLAYLLNWLEGVKAITPLLLARLG